MWKAEELLRNGIDTFVERWKGIRIPNRNYNGQPQITHDIHVAFTYLREATQEHRVQEARVFWKTKSGRGKKNECVFTMVVAGTIMLNADGSYPLDFEETSIWEIEKISIEWNRPRGVKRFFELSGREAFEFASRLDRG